MDIQFSRKAVVFYASTLAAVTLLFQQVTRYGEAHLQAPPNLNGRYVSAKQLPGCPAETRLALEVQQSGIYLSGSLHLVKATQTATETAAPVSSEEKPSLQGLWQSSQLMLSGTTPAFADCQISNAASTSVSIQGSLIPQPPGLSGKIALGAAEPIALTAQREVAPTPSSKH